VEKKLVAIISGKGGVGKTSLTASLASLASRDSEIKPIILDCDVDAPNLAIILPAKSEDKIDIIDTYTTMKAEFLIEKCIHCKKCVEEHFCEFSALRWNSEEEIPIIDYLACEGCGACKVLCPEQAFKIDAVKSGEIISYKIITGEPFVYGKTRLGSTTSGKLVSDIKEYIKHIPEFRDGNLILIDGPPGIGCPVIATVSGLDYVITITEPTPSGLHDLMRAIEVVEQFKIPFGIIINKADLESSFQDDIKTFIKDTKYDVLGEIKFDLAIPESMSYAKPVIDYAPDSSASKSIEEIFNILKQVLWAS